MAATIDALCKELEGLVKSVPAFKNNCFSVSNLDDMEQFVRDMQKPPVVGVGYDGAQPVSQSGTAADMRSHSVAMVELQFLVIIVVQYKNPGQNDMKKQATDLLDHVRGLVNGYKNVNSRPWRFAGERPEPSMSTDGLAFYSQVWRTYLPSSGSFNQ